MNAKMIATLVLSTVAASAFAMSAGAVNDKQVLKDEKGRVHTVLGQLGQVEGTTAEERAIQALEKEKRDFGFEQAAGNFKTLKSSKDEAGVTHTKLQSIIEGIPVFGEEMIVHEKAGDVEGITGDYQDLHVTAPRAALSFDDAIAKAIAKTGFTGELSEPTKAEIVYLPVGDEAVLCYQVSVRYLADTPGNWTLFVNATDGSIVNAVNAIEMATGSGVGVLGDTKSLNTTLKSGSYYLEDQTKPMYAQKGSTINTYDFRSGSRSQYHMTDTDNNWNTSTQAAAVDAHYYASKVYDFYYNQLGRSSYDGQGATIISGVHYSRKYNNAFWSGSQMVYGDGDGTTFLPLSGGYDVVAHELTHAVTAATCNLIYQDQSGALNESWSDAMAAVMDGDDWLIGEDIYTPGITGDGLRSLSDPEAYGQPSTMAAYVSTTSDNGGVHTNSGIPNKAFYNFATGIGSRQIASKVWYVASRDYMTASTNFSGARAATLQATAALYGANSTYYTALQNAWTAVGVN